MTILVKHRKKPFAVVRVGIKGYKKGEKQLWKDLPQGCKITFCHILKRIDVEFRMVKKEGWPSEKSQFYPYLLDLSGFESRAKSAFAGLHEPIETFFIPTRTDEDDYTDEFPESRWISWETDFDRSQCVEVGREKHRLPDYIRIGDAEKPYPVLLIDEFVPNKKMDSDILDCSGAYCGGRSWNVPLSSGWRAFDVFENDKIHKCKGSKFIIVATAQLIPPYWGWALPSCSTIDSV